MDPQFARCPCKLLSPSFLQGAGLALEYGDCSGQQEPSARSGFLPPRRGTDLSFLRVIHPVQTLIHPRRCFSLRIN